MISFPHNGLLFSKIETMFITRYFLVKSVIYSYAVHDLAEEAVEQVLNLNYEISAGDLYNRETAIRQTYLSSQECLDRPFINFNTGTENHIKCLVHETTFGLTKRMTHCCVTSVWKTFFRRPKKSWYPSKWAADACPGGWMATPVPTTNHVDSVWQLRGEIYYLPS